MTAPADYVSPTAATLGVYLATPDIDEARATLLIGQAENLCRSIVNPLPAGAEAVVLSVAARVYVNPSQATSQTAGPFNVAQPFPGLYLTRADKATLRRLGGVGGGAFSIDPTSADVLSGYADALDSPTLDDSEQYLMDEGFA